MQQTSFIFDLDGTIWDSRPWYRRVLLAHSRLARSEADLEAELDQEHNAFKLAKNHGISTNSLIQFAKDQSCGIVRLYDGVIPTLKELCRRKVLFGVVSNLQGQLANALLQSSEISQYFDLDVVMTPRRDIPPKPNPRGTEHLISTFFANVSQTGIWFVGDTEQDAQTANSTGVKFAWASYGYGKVQPHDTVRKIKHFSEILEF